MTEAFSTVSPERAGPISVLSLVGKRVLAKVANDYRSKHPEEYRVREVSPTGHWVKLQNIHGTQFWKPVNEFLLVEELREVKPERPPA